MASKLELLNIIETLKINLDPTVLFEMFIESRDSFYRVLTEPVLGIQKVYYCSG